jgi:pimeloyl-ACP methyl ester carboxylesterase
MTPGEKLRETWTNVDGLRIFARVSADAVDIPDRAEPTASPQRDRPFALPSPRLPLVLVPGLNVSGRHYIRLAQLLSPYLQVHAPDLPGYGRSSTPRRLLTLRDLSDTLAAYLRARGIERAAFFGTSFSAQIVADFAIRHSEHITHAILASPTVDPSSRPLPKLLYRWRVNEHREPPYVGQVTKRDYQDVSRLRALWTMWLMIHDHLERRLSQMAPIPTLVVRGGNDPIITQQWAEKATYLVPRGRLIVIPGAAHAINLDQPVRLARVIRAFLCPAYREAAYTSQTP